MRANGQGNRCRARTLFFFLAVAKEAWICGGMAAKLLALCKKFQGVVSQSAWQGRQAARREQGKAEGARVAGYPHLRAESGGEPAMKKVRALYL